MPELSFRVVPGTHLSAAEVREAAAFLGTADARWRTDAHEHGAAAAGGAGERYAEALVAPHREVYLGRDGERLCGVFVHTLSPEHDQVPVRLLSHGALAPSPHDATAPGRIAAHYAEFAKQQGEDIVATIDPEQTTLGTLLLRSGFREVVDRNETYFLLSRLLRRRILSSHRVRGDFVVDEIVELEGKSIRRRKKLLVLQTSPFDAYAAYRQQQLARVQRSIPPANLALLGSALQAPGLFVVSDFDGTITVEDEAQGGYDSSGVVVGPHFARVLDEVCDVAASILYLVPGSEQELRAIADRVVWRPGFFDFLCFCVKVLGSFFVTSAATPYQVRYALERAPGAGIPLRFADLVEDALTPEAELVTGLVKRTSDGALRTAYRFGGPYIDLRSGRWEVKKDLMIERILDLKGDTPAPLLYLGNDLRDATAATKLFTESAARRLPVVVFDFGTELTRWGMTELVQRSAAPNPYFAMVSVRDFYQIPTMLAEMGLEVEPGVELGVAG